MFPRGFATKIWYRIIVDFVVAAVCRAYSQQSQMGNNGRIGANHLKLHIDIPKRLYYKIRVLDTGHFCCSRYELSSKLGSDYSDCSGLSVGFFSSFLVDLSTL